VRATNATGDSAYSNTATATTQCPTGLFLAEYFNNTALSGNAVFNRCESSITENWGSGGPGNGVATDNFSVRWSGRFNFAAGTYAFTATADDGIRVFVDGVQIINAWVDQGATTYQASRTLSAGQHDVRVEYYERGGQAVAKVKWAAPNSTGTCSAGQFLGEYFNNRTLSGTPNFRQCESNVTYDWGTGSPGGGIGSDNFSAKWSGRFTFLGGSYTFTATASDGVRVYLDGTRIIDAWVDQSATTYQTARTVAAGDHDVRLEYYERNGSASIELSW
jgi:hypothetical protein